jgi:serine protease AprX
MRPRLPVLLSILLVMSLLSSGGALAQPSSQARGGLIRLKMAQFNPSAGERPNVPQRLLRQALREDLRGYYLVQFSGPVEQVWKDEVSALGGELIEYVPDNAFKVRMRPSEARQAARLGNVAWVGFFEPAFAISPAIAGDNTQLLRVRVERGGNQVAVAALAAQLGAAAAELSGDELLIAADRSQLEALATQGLDVAWIEPYTLFEKHNEYGGAIIMGTGFNSAYDGSTQIAAVADTGIGGGTAATAHRDIPSSRVTAIQNFPGVTDSCFQAITNDGAVDVDSGHGTHVAGSVLSGGDPGGFGRGVAPAAKLVFQATENYVTVSSLCRNLYGYQNGYYLTGLNNLYNLFQQAYTAGARIHANSWGSSVAGQYTANSASADDFIWDNKDMTITFSAGNSGVDANANGVVDNDSIGAPATAKNVITIGASENDRQGNYQCDTGLTYTSRDTSYQSGQTCSSMSGQNLLGTPRQRWGFTANPVADDLSGGNAEQMAAFSSRGPTDDGRIKPDVVAPGTWILSTYSDMYQEGYDASPNPTTGAYQSDGWGIARNAFYKYFGGTSMSNPIAAGGATVVRDFYQKVYSASASSALVKATLINSAVDLLDENNDGANDNDFPIPNVHEGWGRINLGNATDGSAKYVDSGTALATGASRSFDAVVGGGSSLKVTLVWSDFAAAANAASTLVNNLNLTVTAPDGTTVYRGNVFSGGWSASGGSADSVNNVENVYLQSATAGTWRVQVSGANVPSGPQPFALVVDGASTLTEVVAPPPVTPTAPSGLTATALTSTSIRVNWVDNSSNETGFAIESCRGSSCTNFAQVATVGAGVTTYTNTGLRSRSTYRYRVRALGSAGNSGYSNTASATTPR